MQPPRRRIDPGKVPPETSGAVRWFVNNAVALGYAWPRMAPPLRALAWVVTAVTVATILFAAQLMGLPIQPAFKFLVSAGSATKHALVR